MGNLNAAPRSVRVHIAFFGRRNAGKSSLVNAISGQGIAIVSDVPGTTTDPVYKAAELPSVGPCVFVDTAGFDDQGALGEMRIQKTEQALAKTDIAVLAFPAGGAPYDAEYAWAKRLKDKKLPAVCAVTKADLIESAQKEAADIAKTTGFPAVCVSASTGAGVDKLRDAIIAAVPADSLDGDIIGNLAGAGDSVLLVMPQDASAPKGRLILPQVQTIRALLDKQAVITCTTFSQLDSALGALKTPPKLIITDSQVFDGVYQKTPKGTLLTSFSVLFANYKGDVDEYILGAQVIDKLKPGDRVLIAEACTHTTQDGDIARVKLPAMLKKAAGGALSIDFAAGTDFLPEHADYKLVIHCGGCMFNRAHILNRIALCREKGIPITNYGIAIAKMTGILDRIVQKNTV